MKNMMKKSVVLSVLLLICTSLFCESAKVTYVKGKVEVERNGKWVPLKVNDELKVSETISTGFNSEAKLEYAGSVMSLGAVTRITLEALSQESSKNTVSAYLKTGAVRSKVTHSDGKRVEYTVKSPVAVASVRGTDFVMFGNGTVTCSEGAVAVFPNMENRRAKNNEARVDDSEEESSEEDQSPASTGDYGSATSTTPASEISTLAPEGAIVVSKNQEVKIKITGNPETPLVNTQKKTEQQKNLVSTAAQQEAVSVGGSSVNTPSINVIDAPSSTVAEISVKIILQD